MFKKLSGLEASTYLPYITPLPYFLLSIMFIAAAAAMVAMATKSTSSPVPGWPKVDLSFKIDTPCSFAGPPFFNIHVIYGWGNHEVRSYFVMSGLIRVTGDPSVRHDHVSLGRFGIIGRRIGRVLFMGMCQNQKLSLESSIKEYGSLPLIMWYR